MDFGKYLSSPEYDITIITYRDIFQSSALEKSVFSDEYKQLSAILKMDIKDIKKMDLKEGGAVYLKSPAGEVLVKAMKSDSDIAHENVAYMPNSPWSNALVQVTDDDNGVPRYKHIKATIRSAGDKDITPIENFLNSRR